MNRELTCLKANLTNQRFYIQILEQQNNEACDRIRTYSKMIIRALREQLQQVDSGTNVKFNVSSYYFIITTFIINQTEDLIPSERGIEGAESLSTLADSLDVDDNLPTLLEETGSSHDDFLTSSEGMSNLVGNKATGRQTKDEMICMHDDHSASSSKLHLQKEGVLNKQNQIHVKVSEIIDHEKRWVAT